jgi:hypothetical protein
MKYGYLLHLKPKAPSIHLHFGGCFAKGLETVRRSFYEKGLAEDEALYEGFHAIVKMWGVFVEDEKSPKTLASCLIALDSYFKQYPLASDIIQPVIGEDGKAKVEFSFALPIPGLEHPNGGPILYAGRFDMLAHGSGAKYIEDDKTTGSLGTSWAKSWDLNSQMTGYIWGARQYMEEVQAAIIRGVGILKTQISHLQVTQYRQNWMIERWLNQLRKDVERMKVMWEKDDWDLNLDASCTSYGGCSYNPLCLSQDPTKWFSEYEVRPWSPLHVEGD